MANLYYNKEADTAFRIRSKFDNTCWCVTVKTNNGRSKMYASEFAMKLSTIAEEVKAGKLFELHNPKTISRDINFIRAGKTPPAHETKTGKTKRGDFRMKVDSLLDEAGTYVGIYNADGILLGHERNGELKLKEQEPEEQQETINPNQLSIF